MHKPVCKLIQLERCVTMLKTAARETRRPPDPILIHFSMGLGKISAQPHTLIMHTVFVEREQKG